MTMPAAAPQQQQMTLEDLRRIFRQLSPEQAAAVTGKQPIPPGALVQYYNDLASGVIAPEDMRIENLPFRVQIDPAGNILSQTAAITLVRANDLTIILLYMCSTPFLSVGGSPRITEPELERSHPHCGPP